MLTPYDSYYIICLALSFPAVATSPTYDASGESSLDLTDAEIKLVESIFESSSDIKLIDNEGNDVKQEFIDQHQNDYDIGDYKKLIDSVADDSLTLLEPSISVASIEEQNIVPRRIALKRTARATKTIKLRNDHGALTSNKFILTLEADYSVIDSNTTINGAESSIRVVSQQNVPETLQTKIVGRSGEAAVVLSDRKSIKFSYSNA